MGPRKLPNKENKHVLLPMCWLTAAQIDLHGSVPAFERRTKETHVGSASLGGSIGYSSRVCRHLTGPWACPSSTQFHPHSDNLYCQLTAILTNTHPSALLSQCWSTALTGAASALARTHCQQQRHFYDRDSSSSILPAPWLLGLGPKKAGGEINFTKQESLTHLGNL